MFRLGFKKKDEHHGIRMAQRADGKWVLQYENCSPHSGCWWVDQPLNRSDYDFIHEQMTVVREQRAGAKIGRVVY